MSSYTLLHVALSVIGIASGWAALFGGPLSRGAAWLAALFLASTVVTSLTGLGFVLTSWRIGIGHVVAVLSLAALALALDARYRHRLQGAARWVYVAAGVVALYLNAFILLMQAFAKIAVLRPLAPSLDATPLLGAHGALLALFITLGALAVRRALKPPAKPQRRMPRPDTMLIFLTGWRLY